MEKHIMTQEEAIEIIKRNCRNCTGRSQLRDACTMFIPELAESEDERIRKSIVSIINQYARMCEKEGDPCEASFINDALAYLEKQKENIEKEYVFRPLAGTDIAEAAIQAIRRAKEGENLVFAFNGMYVPLRKYNSAKELVDEYEAYLEKKKEQKPSISCGHENDMEWSEEDKRMLKVAIKSCEQTIEDYPNDKVRFKDCIDWLKSLRSQPHWKPTQEQIQLLQGYVSVASTLGDGAKLKKLIGDLKKL